MKVKTHWLPTDTMSIIHGLQSVLVVHGGQQRKLQLVYKPTLICTYLIYLSFSHMVLQLLQLEGTEFPCNALLIVQNSKLNSAYITCAMRGMHCKPVIVEDWYSCHTQRGTQQEVTHGFNKTSAEPKPSISTRYSTRSFRPCLVLGTLRWQVCTHSAKYYLRCPS